MDKRETQTNRSKVKKVDAAQGFKSKRQTVYIKKIRRKGTRQY